MSRITQLIIGNLLIAFLGCHTVKKGPYKTQSYVWVGKQFDRVRAPYVIDVKQGAKRLVFIGCEHVYDTTHRQYDAIDRHFAELKPQIAFNEGGTVTRRFASRNEAIRTNSETGYIKYLSDQAGISLVNGDLPDSLEFTLTLKKYPKDQLFLYYIMERLVIPYLSGAYGQQPFEPLYDKAIREWFVADGFPLTENERSFTYFQNLYRQYIGHPFVLSINPDIELFDYVNGGGCHFCAIGRTSKMVRDSVLLSKIDQAFNQYDRVLVTFGHGHALALEPALKQLIRKKR